MAIEETYIREQDRWRGLTTGSIIPATDLTPQNGLGISPLGITALGG